ncbi:helix-turn-helix domain-containing protein [Empedobacter falsenii]|uniref:DNA-binding protein n=1 Tax=Empedobacter falsenii TaxID=343874 RepID=A0A3R8Z6B1_9FLAO|nr:helix-turn-helix domain-containing protein [Empedobacter falsenii]RRT86448.1 DNA-binding protein [Empedobacter falsenii]RRT87519.1 DNA-binding protein [Empedobacter falsenii]
MSVETKQDLNVIDVKTFEQLKTSLIAEIIPHLKNSNPSNDLGLLTRDDVLNIFKINISTLTRWQKEKTLPFIKIGGRVYFKRAEIETMLNIKSN